MEEDEDFLGGGVTEPEGFGAVGEGDTLGRKVLLFGVGEVLVFEGWDEPLEVFGRGVAAEGSDESDLCVVDQTGGARAATKDACEEGEEAG